ncbi:hypothetical protein [Microbacterium sp. MMO-56]|uniref:hypothetical protein n=1 Tax=Microbacterium sp. MMO-56 TaxID=3081281 RepID=UPI003018DEE0
MSLRRLLAAAVVVGVAIACMPAAQAPGINSADLICILAPLALLTVCVARRPKTPVEAPSRLPQDIPSRGLDGTNQEGQDR